MSGGEADVVESTPDDDSPREGSVAATGGPKGSMQYELGVSSGMGSGVFWRTKIISICHRFMFVNRSGRDLLLRQVGVRQRPVLLRSAVTVAWHWPQRASKSEPMLSVALQSPTGVRGRWSSEFAIHDLGATVVKLAAAADQRGASGVGHERSASCELKLREQSSRRAGAEASTSQGELPFVLRVEVTLLRATVLVRFSAEDKSLPPYRLINKLQTPVYCSQRGVPGMSTYAPSQGAAPYVLEAPSLPPVVQLTMPQLAPASLVEVNLTRIGEQTSFPLPTPFGEVRRVYCLVEAEGPTKVLTMAEEPLLSHQAALVEDEEAVTSKYLLSVATLGVSLLDDKPQELLYLSSQSIQLELAVTAAAISMQLSLRTLQLDNQLVCPTYPVLLRANPRAHAKSSFFLQLSALYLRRHTSLHYLRHLSLFLQECDVALDWELATPMAEVIIRLIKQLGDVKPSPGQLREPRSEMTPHPASAPPTIAVPSVPGAGGGTVAGAGGGGVGPGVPVAASTPAAVAHGTSTGGFGESEGEAANERVLHPPKKCYIELMTLHPIVLNYTSSSSTGFANMQRLGASLHTSSAHFLGGYVLGVLNALGVMLTSVENARLRLNALVLRHPCETIRELMSRIGTHYVYQASQALLRIAGDLDLLGSPVAMLGNLGSGVRDFFYEPANAMLHHPRELHLAVAKGTLSLMRSTVLSTADTASKVSGTLGKGLAALSMDDAFMRRRAARMAAQRPHSLAEGLRDGARNLGFSVAEGASGLLTSPLSGARRDGVKGALVGVAQGVVGVALKPAAGVLDLATKSAEAMRYKASRSTPTSRASGAEGVSPAHRPAVDACGRARARPPHALGPDATLQVYDLSKAALREVLLRVEAGAYRSEELTGHVGLGAYSLLCTEQRVLFVRTSSWAQSWQVPWRRLKGCDVQPERRLVVLQLFAESETLSLFGAATRVVTCPNDAAVQLVYAAVQQGRAQYTKALTLEALSTKSAAQRLGKAVRGV